MEYLIVRNNVAPYKQVFEYLELSELRNPSPKLKLMLSDICDSIEFIKSDSLTGAYNMLNDGDWLFDILRDKIIFAGMKKHSKDISDIEKHLISKYLNDTFMDRKCHACGCSNGIHKNDCYQFRNV